MVFKKILLSVFIIGACVHLSYGQSSAELKKQLEKINADISALNKELSAKTKEKLLSQKEVNALSRQLNLREDKITIINRELNNLSKQINDNTKSVNELKAELEKMRQDYEKMVLFAFRNKNAYNKMMFIFASKDFNQAFKRVKYLQQFTDARKIKAAEIEGVKKEIELKIARLESDRKMQNELLAEQRKEKDVIAKDRSEHQVQLNQLAKEEKSFKGQLSVKQQEKKKMEALIRAAVQREIAEERRKAEAERKRLAEAEAKRTGKTVEEVEKKTPKKTDSEILRSTPEAAKLSADFKSNKGRLPWPVSQGNIVRGFGMRTVEGVSAFEPDIAIRTSSGAAVKAVFDGEIVQAISGVIVVRHGEYFSFYSNLASIVVRRGQKVSRGQQLGTAADDPDLGFPIVNFGLSQGQQEFDPSAWIAR
ncbi:murein hydrolase activator EnvC family protein [Sphingobacterium faecale]|uniref:Peptidoglycan DD-metalloendopeptidase family protein n=1 Tax=Sphingobacterium faecale TaxID=2803775 RepID=A0ABS1QZW9_9SPHI|nr:peptidoglycan DD-metalloendopeptidase family protein [Sphingobacterium faecale]MBL1407982.1 peptidoglycan DD-metalloendopeptidase family protein [Sphingobacterium faecale]